MRAATDQPEVVLRGRQRTAFLATAEAPCGLRAEAYPSVMPDLMALGVVEKRATQPNGRRRRTPGWFLTSLGQEVWAGMRREREE